MTNVVRVWAPRARTVDLEIDGHRVAMAREATSDSGWWRVETALVRPGADYCFILDGGAALPDPRSPFQPHGVHGRSRFVDHGAFAWEEVDWKPPSLADAVIYELHVGTFTTEGTFDAAIERLDHLADLGVTHVEVMPVGEFSGDRGWGYDGVDLYVPHHAYGGPEGLKRLVNACHRRGLAVLLDVVYNHFGPSGNYLPRFGPYLTSRYSTPWGDAVNLDDADSDEVRSFFCDNAVGWLRDYHFDGLRIDAVHAIVDTSAIHFLEELATRVDELESQIGRPLVLIAESDLNDPRIVQSPAKGGYGMDAQWSDDFHHALHALLTGETNGYYADFGSLGDLATACEKVFVYDGRYSKFRRRRHGRPPSGLTGDHFVCCSQNHDQVGNRAKGDRSSHLLSTGRLKIAAAMVLMAPFVPLLFQGEEWAASTPFQYFTGHPEADLARAVREGRRREFSSFGWRPEEIPDPQAPETFARSKLNWSELESGRHAEMLRWYRDLIALRRGTASLSAGPLDAVGVRFSEGDRWLTMRRGPIAIAFNISGETQTVPTEAGDQPEILLVSDPAVQRVQGGFLIPPDSVVIYSR